MLKILHTSDVFWHDRSVRGFCPPWHKLTKLNITHTVQSLCMCICMCVNVYFHNHNLHRFHPSQTSRAFASQLLLHCCTRSHQSLHSCSKAWTCFTRSHTPHFLYFFFYMGRWHFKEACTLKSFYGIRSFTALFMLCCSFFFLLDFMAKDHERVQTSHWWIGWSSLNVGLDLPLPSPTPRAVWAECSDQDQLSGPNGGNSFRGGSYLWCRAR